MYIFNGKGDILNFISENFQMDRNDKRKFYSTFISDIKEKVIAFDNLEEFFLYLRLDNIDNNIKREIKEAEPFNEIVQEKYFPIYFYSQNKIEDINFEIINYDNNNANFIIEGMFCNLNLIEYLEKYRKYRF